MAEASAFEDLLELLNAPALAAIWGEDETIGWVYQFFNSADERKKMREESQAPRNSRELAIRNQFFTPRYVVEFLVDNTLGRTWLEMHGESSVLSERCRYFVRTDDSERTPRPKKDPRDIRILDPACGSGHFLLYCFDLLLTIYEEAWASETIVPPGRSARRLLREDYATLDDLRRAVPALIVANNLHGVDIDPRAAQIAALSLWLRAQKAWKDLGVARAERPRVGRTHIVVAEPMPGSAALVEEFAARLEPPLLRDLFVNMVREMTLAGELGSLLPVEKAIAAKVHEAREQFVKLRETTGFLPGIEPAQRQGELDLSGIDDDGFFDVAEARILDALRRFAETAAGDGSVRRRLFAKDAEHGIALIDLLRRRFDVVLMNPPFGAVSIGAKKAFEKAYPRTKNDIFAAFVERGVQLLHPRGLLGAITSRTGFFLSSFQKWREEILLEDAPPIVLADLGLGVMDAAVVEAAAYCLERSGEPASRRTVFLRVLEELRSKEAALRGIIARPDSARGRQRFEENPISFRAVPGTPFAYWVSQRLRRLFNDHPLFEKSDRTARQGLATADDFRFVRLWWEVIEPSIRVRWSSFAKGGKFSPFYSDVPLTVDWYSNGRSLDVSTASVIRNPGFYGRPGLTWPRRTKSELSFRAMPAGCIFADKGPAAFVEDNDYDELLALLAIATSEALRSLVQFQLAAAEPSGRGGVARSYEVGVLQRTPVPRLADECRLPLARLAHRAWSLKRSLDTRYEPSHALVLPTLMQVAGRELGARAAAWSQGVRAVETELADIQAEIDNRCFELYGIDDDDRRAITNGFGVSTEVVANDGADDDRDDDADEDAVRATLADDVTTLAAELVSWAVGVAFGRFDVRLATGARALPAEPEPFDPLPVCSPGMLTGDDGFPLTHPPADYPLMFPETGVLVDDPGHPQDLTAAVRRVFEVVFGIDADRWWTDIGALLDPKGHDVRIWLASGFFDHHLKQYSKSRRKAPILWQLGTPSRRYSVWLYAHRVTRDGLFQLQNDIVGPRLAHEERQLASVRESAGENPSARKRKEIAEHESFVEELRTMLDEVKRIAPLWNPNLDDGVVLVMAPLWRLVQQHKPWQKELKTKWSELAAGKYDWAHLAMHVWPERVVPKCASDRSLAIAHDLEGAFWIEREDGKWAPVGSSGTERAETLVRERTSPAVKAASIALGERR